MHQWENQLNNARAPGCHVAGVVCKVGKEEMLWGGLQMTAETCLTQNWTFYFNLFKNVLL